VQSIPPPADGDQPGADGQAPAEPPVQPDPAQSPAPARGAQPVWPDLAAASAAPTPIWPQPAQPEAAPAPSRPEPAQPEATAPPSRPEPAQPEAAAADPTRQADATSQPPRPGSSTAPAPTGAVAWSPWTAPLALLVWFGATLVLSLVIALVAAAMGYPLDDPPAGVNIAGTFAQDLAMIGAVLLFAFMAARPRALDFGLVRTQIGAAIGGMIAIWIGFIVFSVVWKTAISLNDPQTLPDQLGIEGSTLNLVLVVIIITVLAPVSEELLFRGYMFRALRNWRGFLPAAIITGLVFGAVHIGSSPLGFALPLAAFGFGLCLLYQRTGSLYPCIALHALNNAFALGLDQKWGWEIAPVMVGAVVVSLTLAWLLGRAVDRKADAAAQPLPQPA
jgi:membrane protease YdiL (CAAX protease family)